MQTGDPNSDDELLLMSEVESLQSQLKKNGETLNEKFENIFLQSLHDKPLPDRIRKWTIRRDHLRKMAQSPHATSGGPAVSLDVDSTLSRLKADQHVGKQEEEEQKKRVKCKRTAGDEMPREKQKHRGMPTYVYKKPADAQPPVMSQIHVDFAHMSVAYLRSVDRDAVQKDLISHFNSSENARRAYHRVAKGNKGHGNADYFFVNGYFKIADLRLMAAGKLPMPVPLKQDPDGREYSLYEAGVNAVVDAAETGSPVAAAAAGGSPAAAAAAGGDGQDGRSRGGHPTCAAAEAAAHGGAAETAVRTPRSAAPAPTAGGGAHVPLFFRLGESVTSRRVSP